MVKQRLLGSSCSGRIGSGEALARGDTFGQSARQPVLPTKARPAGEVVLVVLAPAIRVCSPTPCARCSRPTWWSMTGWSRTR